MSTDSWTGASADWNNAANWSGGLPSASTTATIGGPGNFLVTLFGTGTAAALNLTAQGAEFYDAGLLNLGGVLNLATGTLALAYGEIAGGTLALNGGQFLSTGGTLAGVAVDGTLSLSTPEASLFVTGGLSLAGAGGSGAGSIALTGGYASLDFVGSQTLNNAVVSIGAGGALPGQAGAASLAVAAGGGATTAATLTLGAGLWLRGVAGQGQVLVGGAGPVGGGSLPAALVNAGTITAGAQGEMLAITGAGSFANTGTIAVSNGATLQIATGAFSNTGTITVSHATLSLGGTFSAARLSSLGSVTFTAGQLQLAGTVQNYGGTLTVGGTSRLGTAFGAIALSGTIAGGTVADGGHGLSFAAGTGVLDGVSYVGTVDLSPAGSAVTLTDGTSVSTAGGGAGSITVTGAGSALLLLGTEALDNAQIALGSAGSESVIATTDPWLASTATTATLGAHVTVSQAGANAAIEALGWSAVPGFGLADTVVNQGNIAAGFAGGEFALGGYGTIVNQGVIAVSGGDTLAVSVAQFANTGTLQAQAGGTILLGQPAIGLGAAPAWSNTGLIAISGGTLVLGGAFTTAQLGTVSDTGGTVSLTGTLANAGGTLTLGAGASAWPSLSLSGTIAGGTILDSSGALQADSAGGALLDGVTYQGTLALAAAGSFLRVRDGLALTGVADVLGAGAVLDFQGSQTFNRAAVLLGAAGTAAAIDVAHDPTVSGGSTLVLGSRLSITQSGQYAAIGRTGGTGVTGDMIVNQGTITASVAGGTLTLGGPAFSNQGRIVVGQGETLSIAAQAFSNTGTIVATGGVVSIAGSLTLGQLGQVSLANGALAVAGTLDLGGGMLAIGTGSADGRVLLTGTVRNGTIVDAGGGLAPTGNATLAGVTYDGTLDLSRPFGQLAVTGGITLGAASGGGPGAILLTGAQIRLIATGTETINAATISLGSVSQYYAGQKLAAPELAAAAGVALTLGAATTLTLAGTAGTLGDSGLGQWSDSIVNQGTIRTVGLGTLNIGASFFTNTGTITVAGGGIVALGDVGFTNTGTIAVAAGSALVITLLDYYAAPDAGAGVFTNSGVIAMQGGILQEPTGNGLFPQVPIANLAGASIIGSGLVFAEIANSGTIEAHGGSGLYFAQSVLGSGALLIDAGSTLEFAAAVTPNQTVRFTSNTGTLRLDAPSTFAGTLSGLSGGNLIDLPGQILTGVGLSSGTLVASTATQNYRFVGTTPLGGEVSAGRDAHGGATVSFLQQTPGTGAPAAIIPVSQPAMLFWASPAGDVFQGLTANIAGAHISNWGAADSLDITDLNPAQAALSTMQTTGLDTLTISDGTHSASVGLTGTYSAGGFSLASDGHGGTMLAYHG